MSSQQEEVYLPLVGAGIGPVPGVVEGAGPGTIAGAIAGGLETV